MKVILAGYDGKMSGHIRELLACEDLIVGGTEKDEKDTGLTRGAIQHVGLTTPVYLHQTLGEAIVNAPHFPEVVIAFTEASVSVADALTAAAAGIPMVVGTTGLNDEQRLHICEASRKIPIVLASNMSVGVNLLLKVLADIASVLNAEDFDVDIVEAHHRLKKDAPSGTALAMAKVIAEARGHNLSVINCCRHGLIGVRPMGEIGIQALRVGDVVGEHTVIFGGPGERIEITHKASSRAVFAKGAVRAARWVIGQKPGLYDMQDVLDLK